MKYISLYTQLRNILVLFSLVCVVFVGIPVRHVNAVLSVVDANAGANATKDFITQGKILAETTYTALENKAQTVLQYELATKESILDAVAWGLANHALEQMILSTTRWVNSGFEGSPAYVTNFEDFLFQVSNEALGQFIQKLGVGELCAPFQSKIKLQLEVWYGQSTQSYRGECRLSQVVGNVEEFLNNPTGSGWDGWYAFTVDGSNPYSQYLGARQRLLVDLGALAEKETAQLVGQDFFLSKKECFTVTGPEGERIEQCDVITPGSTISAGLANALGGAQNRLTVADEINELIGALFSQMGAQIFSGGGGGLKGISDSRYNQQDSSDYLTAIENDRSAIGFESNSNDPIANAIQTETEYLREQERILSLVVGAATARSVCPQGTGALPDSLLSASTSAATEIRETSNLLDRLQVLSTDRTTLQNTATPQATIDALFDRYTATNISGAQAAILTAYTNLASGGTLHTPREISDLRLTTIPALTTQIAELPACIIPSSNNIIDFGSFRF